MNATLPRTSLATRLNAVIAALVVTLATLSGIDHLAATGTPSFTAQAAVGSQRA